MRLTPFSQKDSAGVRFDHFSECFHWNNEKTVKCQLLSGFWDPKMTNFWLNPSLKPRWQLNLNWNLAPTMSRYSSFLAILYHFTNFCVPNVKQRINFILKSPKLPHSGFDRGIESPIFLVKTMKIKQNLHLLASTLCKGICHSSTLFNSNINDKLFDMTDLEKKMI